jgi:hypothetical protein
MKSTQNNQLPGTPDLRAKLKGARRSTSTWALWVGLIVGALCSMVVALDWISGAALHHGSRAFIETLISTIVILGFTIDSEIRLRSRMIRK